MSRSILSVQNITKKYIMGEVTVEALRGVSFEVGEGEFVVVLGPSGSGKSTILNIVGGIDAPTAGEIYYKGAPLHSATEKQLTRYRRESVGFVFQFYNLIPNLTARENIELASELSPCPISADELLGKIDLADRGGHYPAKMSVWQQQRVAIARSIA
jgi:putative ABC transport system ATP-binding protein